MYKRAEHWAILFAFGWRSFNFSMFLSAIRWWRRWYDVGVCFFALTLYHRYQINLYTRFDCKTSHLFVFHPREFLIKFNVFVLCHHCYRFAFAIQYLILPYILFLLLLLLVVVVRRMVYSYQKWLSVRVWEILWLLFHFIVRPKDTVIVSYVRISYKRQQPTLWIYCRKYTKHKETLYSFRIDIWLEQSTVLILMHFSMKRKLLWLSQLLDSLLLSLFCGVFCYFRPTI